MAEERLWSLMAACDVCVNLRSPTMGETSGSVIRQLSLGKPVVVSDVGWFAELPDDVALKVPVDDEETSSTPRSSCSPATRRCAARCRRPRASSSGASTTSAAPPTSTRPRSSRRPAAGGRGRGARRRRARRGRRRDRARLPEAAELARRLAEVELGR